MYMVWVIFFVISIVVGVAWIFFGPGNKQIRMVLGGSLIGGIICLWSLALSGLFIEKVSYVMSLIALVFGVLLLLLPIAYKALLNRNVSV
mgnify:CR=1 FL=1